MSSNNDNTKKKVGWNVKEAISTLDLATGQTVRFTPEKFDEAILSKGVRVKVYRTMRCPGRKSVDGGEHEIDCQVPGCNGSGFVDIHPISTHAVIQSQTQEWTDMPEGFVDGNTVQGTFARGIELTYFTLVSLCDYTEITDEVVKRSEGDIDVLRYEAMRVNVVLDKNGIEYYQGIDFNLDENGNIRWIANHGPDKFELYSIHYEMPIQFRAIRAIHNNRFTQIPGENGQISFLKMSETWMLSKEYLVKRTDSDGNQILPNLIREPDTD